MEDEIGADAQLGFVAFRIKPENRYDACICRKEEEEEIIGNGPLDQLLRYLPTIKDQVNEGSCDSFKLELPDDVDDKTWFTKVTLTRFLRIISSPESLNKSIAISKEMSQLEETRKFQLSLYSKAEDGIMSSDNSKNELLQAMDSRLAALMEELVSTFAEAAGATLSYQEMTDLQQFFDHFGDEDIRNLFSKLSKTSQKSQTAIPPNNKKSSGLLMSNDEHVNKTSDKVQSSALLNCDKPVVYNASPAKAAGIERQSSTESDNSSFSSEDDQPSVERSRTLIRSASPRRSASPMRRVQIGRSGPRRTPAITIKSLTCFPARERISLHRDIEEPEESNKKTEVNVTRMSVQDAISLFESKQRDQTSDGLKKSTVDSSSNANKSVLRRWSAGMGESQKFLAPNMSENTASENNSDVVDEDAQKDEVVKSDMNMNFENLEAQETVRFVDIETDSIDKTELIPNEDDFPDSQTEKISGKMDSVEWSRQKEAELSQMLMKFAEYKNAEPDSGKMRNTSLKQRRSYGPQKEKKDGTRRDENGGKKAQSEFRTRQKVLDQPKTEKSSKVTDAGKKFSTSRSSAVNKNSPVPVRAKKESPKPAVTKRVPSKPTPLPATRKSWPSTPSPRATGVLPAKIPTGTTSGTLASRQKPQSPVFSQKPQSPAPVSRASPKLERTQLQQKDAKKAQVETQKRVKRVDNSKNNSVLPKSGRTMKTKPKIDVTTEKDVGASPVKAAVRKGTKKSSVVPLEAKPCTTRKGSGTSPARNPSAQKIEIRMKVEETSIKSEDPIMSHENADSTNSDVAAHQSMDTPLSETQNGDRGKEREPEAEKPKDGGEEKTSDETPVQVDEIPERTSESPAEAQPTQEPIISPSAWEESSQQDLPIPGGNSDAPSPVNHLDVVASPEPRVRHSLSQMLLEESSEPDIIEWGNAENPPTMVYQKDAPKGLKRLLKFARKNKAEANGTAWSSPYTSEGEDDGDEAKSLGKRHSDNLLRKVALHSKNYGEGFLSDSEPLSARSNASNSSARSSNKFHEGHTTSKGTRFFSLSAFRSSKN